MHTSLDGGIKLWSTHTHVEVGAFFGHTQPIRRAVFSRTGLELATVAADRTVKLWSGHLGRPLVDSGDMQQGWVAALAFAPDGTYMAVAFRSGKVHVRTPDTTLVAELTAHDCSANAVAWLANRIRVMT